MRAARSEKVKRASRKSAQPARRTFSTDVETLRRIAFSFPGVEEGTSYGTRALRVKGKFWLRLKEDGQSVVFRVGFDERDLLMQTKPKVFYITDHYKPCIVIFCRPIPQVGKWSNGVDAGVSPEIN